MVKLVKCTKCSADNPEGENFCKSCGTRLGASVAQVVSAPRSSASDPNKKIVVIALLAIVCISLVLVAVWWPKGAPAANPGPSAPTAQRIRAGEPYECAGRALEGNGLMSEGTIKVEYPKFSTVITGYFNEEGLPDKIVSRLKHSASGKIYAYDLGEIALVVPGVWIELDPNDPILSEFTPESLSNLTNSGFESYDCRFVADIPDSEFELPAGVRAMTPSELGQALGQQPGGSNTGVDNQLPSQTPPSGLPRTVSLDDAYAAAQEDSPIHCRVTGTHHLSVPDVGIDETTQIDQDYYIESDKYATYDRLKGTFTLVYDGITEYGYNSGYYTGPCWQRVEERPPITVHDILYPRETGGLERDDQYDCEIVADVPDAKFRLPYNAKICE